MKRIVGVESSHSFGDTLFNVPLIQQLSQKFSAPVGVAVQPQHADGFHNVPWISEIIHIPGMRHGLPRLKELGYEFVYQITQNEKFVEFRNHKDENHSLIDTPLWVGRQLGLSDFDQRPMFFPTPEEEAFSNYFAPECSRPTIAVECIAKSGQSWADGDAINMIMNKYANTHKILWLSNQGAPSHPNVDNLLRFSRRQVIMLLRYAQIFFSVGSGFFCSSLALPTAYQPRKIVCLWIDHLYRYEGRVEQWHKDITWVHNHSELQSTLQNLG